MKYARVKSAIVEWGMPEKLTIGLKKMHDYAKWDAAYGIWWHPVKRFSSHNIKVLLILGRYIAGLIFLIFSFRNPPLLPILISGVLLYGFWAFRKVYLETKDMTAGLWGIIIQFSADFAVMMGFLKGLGSTQETSLPR